MVPPRSWIWYCPPPVFSSRSEWVGRIAPAWEPSSRGSIGEASSRVRDTPRIVFALRRRTVGEWPAAPGTRRRAKKCTLSKTSRPVREYQRLHMYKWLHYIWKTHLIGSVKPTFFEIIVKFQVYLFFFSFASWKQKWFCYQCRDKLPICLKDH